MTDGRTDRRTEGQTEFSSLYRVCITCSAVKTLCFGAQTSLMKAEKSHTQTVWAFRSPPTTVLLWLLTVCPISSASGSDAESYNAVYCETVYSRLQLELIHSYSRSAAFVRPLEVRDSCHNFLLPLYQYQIEVGLSLVSDQTRTQNRSIE